nr:unnamed protein product [Spirometra erinaceieuropaei]
MDDSKVNVDVFRMADPIGGILRSMPHNICEGCHAPIDERVFLAVDNQLWHAACLRCDACRGDLQWDQSCFIYKGRVLCRADYQSLSLCPGCDRRLSEDDLVFRLTERIVYHSECLRCHACGVVLRLGDTYALLGGRSVVCAKHATEAMAAADVNAEPQIYEGASYSDQQSGVITTERGAPGTRKGKKPGKRSSKKTYCSVQFDRLTSLSSTHVRRHQQQLQEPSLFTEDNSPLGQPTKSSKLSVPVDKSKKTRASRCRSSAINGTTRSKKRIRTSFKHDQLRAMKAHFELNQNPDSKDLRKLSDETGLTKRVLQVWFQNARAKYRRWGSLADSSDADQFFSPLGQPDSPDVTQSHSTTKNDQIFAPIRDILPQNIPSDGPKSTSNMEDMFSERLNEWQESTTPPPRDSTHLRRGVFELSAEFRLINLPTQITPLQSQVAPVT